MMRRIEKPRGIQMSLPLERMGQGESFKCWARSLDPDAAAISLRVTGWFLVNGLVVLGLFAFAAMLIGDLTLHGAMIQLENLSSRFIAADELRRASFTQGLTVISLILFLMIGFFRRGSLYRAIAGDMR